MEYKLKYESKEQAIQHLHSLGITDAEGNHDQRRFTLVWLGYEVLELGEFNEQGEVIKEAVYGSNYLVDLKTDNESVYFRKYEVDVKTPKHTFS